MYIPLLFNLLAISFLMAINFEQNQAQDSLTSDPFMVDCVSNHNTLREQEGAPDVVDSDQVIAYAQSRCQDQINNGPSHDGLSDDYGENLFIFPDMPENNVSCSMAGNDWYSEKNLYQGDYSEQSGHFSQMVWKSSTTIGCARCEGTPPSTGQDTTFVVCNYSPPGNMEGEFAENVS